MEADAGNRRGVGRAAHQPRAPALFARCARADHGRDGHAARRLAGRARRRSRRHARPSAARRTGRVQHGQSALHVLRRRSRCDRYRNARPGNRNASAVSAENQRAFRSGRQPHAYPPAHLGARRRRAARFGLVFVRRGGQRHPARAARPYGAGGMRRRRRRRSMGRHRQRVPERAGRVRFRRGVGGREDAGKLIAGVRAAA
ncbi:hypothetical protein EMIT0111MI5_20257 [Burkholderia sp. IT-111MI5]